MRGRYALDFAGIFRRQETQAVVPIGVTDIIVPDGADKFVKDLEQSGNLHLVISADSRVKIWLRQLAHPLCRRRARASGHDQLLYGEEMPSLRQISMRYNERNDIR
jgi:hypothetical protein